MRAAFALSALLAAVPAQTCQTLPQGTPLSVVSCPCALGELVYGVGTARIGSAMTFSSVILTCCAPPGSLGFWTLGLPMPSPYQLAPGLLQCGATTVAFEPLLVMPVFLGNNYNNVFMPSMQLHLPGMSELIGITIYVQYYTEGLLPGLTPGPLTAFTILP